MANKKINQLDVRVPSLTDLMLVGDPATGYSYKATLTDLSALIGSGSIALDNLTDVTITSPTSTQVLRYNGTTWVNASVGFVPVGGTAGQILSKIDATNYNTQWIDNYTSQVKHQVKLGEAIAKGQAVYVSTATGTNMVVSKASNATELTSSKTLGLLETGGILNDIVFVVTEGLLSGLDTSTATIGDSVWLGTSGNLLFGLANKPYAPAHMVGLGIVTRVSSTNGEIFVKVQNGFELDEIHNVSAQSPANNDGIFYNTSTSLWEKKSIATALGYTPVPTTRTLTINGTTFDLSANRSWTIATGGITSLNTLTASTQTFATGTSGTDFNISSTTSTHTFNIPTASSSNRGLLSSANWTTFNNKFGGSLNAGFVPMATSTSNLLENSYIYAANPGTGTFTIVSTLGGDDFGWQVYISPTIRQTNIGDYAQNVNGTRIEIDDIQTTITLWGDLYSQNLVSGTTANIIYYNTATGRLTYGAISASGITTLNTLTAATQTFATGTSGTDFNISSATSTHTFNLPTASSTNRGALSSADWLTFNSKQSAITLTTTGSSGSATFVGSTLNIPTYTLAGLGGISLTSLSASSPLLYNSTTGGFSIQVASSSQNGYLSSSDWSTFNSKQSTITLTTTGSSGAATFTSNTLNIPNYTLAGLGGVPTSRQLTINGVTFDLSADRTWSISTGGITSLNTLTVSSQTFATGTSGTDFNITSASSTHTFNLPTASATNRGALSSADWTTFNSKQAALNGTGFVKISGTTISYDNSTYYLASNPNGYTSNTGTVTSVSALTIGTTGTDITSSVATSTTTPVITLNVPTASATNRGALSSADWSTFNNKQGAITLTTTGSSGAATFTTNTLNIPNYTLAGLGGVPTTRTLTINGTTFDLSANRSWTISGSGITGTQYAIPYFDTTSSVASSFLVNDTINGALRSTFSGNGIGLNLDLANEAFYLGDWNNVTNGTYIIVDNNTRLIRTYLTNVATGIELDAISSNYTLGDYTGGSGNTFVKVEDGNNLIVLNGQLKMLGLNSGTTSNVLYIDGAGTISSGAAPSGGGAYSVTSVTTTYSETATSGTKIIKATTTGGAFTITLPTAVGNTATIIIKKVAGTLTLTIDAAGTETIDGGLTAAIVKVYESVTLISDNANWQII